MALADKMASEGGSEYVIESGRWVSAAVCTELGVVIPVIGGRS